MTEDDSSYDEALMRRGLALAERGKGEGEVPVGAVLTLEERIVAEAWNRPIGSHDPTAHAEIEALRAAGRALGAYRLPGSVLYVTLEPCAMCVAALIHARVARVVFGAPDPKTGACGGAMALHRHPSHNHHLRITPGVLAPACGEQLRRFFRARR